MLTVLLPLVWTFSSHLLLSNLSVSNVLLLYWWYNMSIKIATLRRTTTSTFEADLIWIRLVIKSPLHDVCMIKRVPKVETLWKVLLVYLICLPWDCTTMKFPSFFIYELKYKLRSTIICNKLLCIVFWVFSSGCWCLRC